MRFKNFAILSLAAAMFMSSGGVLAHGGEPHGTQEDAVQHMIEERRQRLELRRAAVQERAEQVKEERRTQLRERQALIRARMEMHHQNRIENMMDNLNAANDRHTDAYLSHLDRIEMVLNKILARMDKMQEQYPDMDLSGVREEADEVRQSIDEARVAVMDQKEKVYTVEINDTETLGRVMHGVVAELRGDLGDLRDEHVHPARRSLHDMFREFKDAAVDYRQSLNGDSEE